MVVRETDPADARSVLRYPTERALETIIRLRKFWSRRLSAALNADTGARDTPGSTEGSNDAASPAVGDTERLRATREVLERLACGLPHTR